MRARAGRVIFPPPVTRILQCASCPATRSSSTSSRAVATFTVEAARLQQDLLRADTNRRGAIVDQIKRLEHQADQVTHDVVTRLDRVFITPLDREDIHLLASRLDDVIDLIDGTARRLHIFHAGDAPARGHAHRRRDRAGHRAAAGGGRERWRRTRAGRCSRPASRSSGWRRRATRSTTSGWAGCSRGSRTRSTVIKWKEIYDNLEKTLDYIEDAGNVLESISIKHA